jgi:hypothetical protein
VVAGQPAQAQVFGGLPLGDPQHVDRPGAQGPLPVSQVAVRGVERGQQPAPRRGQHRIDAFHAGQAVAELGGGQLGCVQVGQQPRGGLQDVQQLAGASVSRPSRRST